MNLWVYTPNEIFKFSDKRYFGIQAHMNFIYFLTKVCVKICMLSRKFYTSLITHCNRHAFKCNKFKNECKQKHIRNNSRFALVVVTRSKRNETYDFVPPHL